MTVDKKNIKLAILIASHKKFIFQYKSDFLQPIHIGTALSDNSLDYLCDDSGDNISVKNKNYCELTAIYWGWKNLKADYYGLMHYRRFLIVRETLFWQIKRGLYYIGRRFHINLLIRVLKMQLLFQIATRDLEVARNLVDEMNNQLPDLLNDFDVILPKKEILSVSVYEQYKRTHCITHLDETLKIIQVLFPEIYPYTKLALSEKYVYCTNMFIMKKEYFTLYTKFIFEVLFELEKRIVIPTDKYQERVFGFIAERLMAPFINYLLIEKQIKIKELNILLINR